MVALKEMIFKKKDFNYLIDLILLANNEGLGVNPVIGFLAEKMNFEQTAVSDAFRYYQYFGRWSEMPFALVLKESNPDADVFWTVFNCWTEENDLDYKKMFQIVTSSLESLPL